METINKLGIAGGTLLLAFMINMIENGKTSMNYFSKVEDFYHKRKNIESSIATLKEIKVSYNIEDKESFENLIKEKKSIVDSLKKEEDLYSRKGEKYEKRGLFFIGYIEELIHKYFSD